jgi:hypothetical protein
MAEELQHVRTLTAARDRLIEERRALAGAIALGYRRRRTDDSHANDMRETFIALQNLIEAIERALTQEETLVGKAPVSSLVPAVETLMQVAETRPASEVEISPITPRHSQSTIDAEIAKGHFDLQSDQR